MDDLSESDAVPVQEISVAQNGDEDPPRDNRNSQGGGSHRGDRSSQGSGSQKGKKSRNSQGAGSQRDRNSQDRQSQGSGSQRPSNADSGTKPDSGRVSVTVGSERQESLTEEAYVGADHVTSVMGSFVRLLE